MHLTRDTFSKRVLAASPNRITSTRLSRSILLPAAQLLGLVGLAHCSGAAPDPTSIDPGATSESQAIYASGSVPGLVTLQGLNGNCIDVIGGNPNPGARVQNYTCNGTNGQQLHVNYNGTITNYFGNCLDVMYGDANAGNLQFYTCNGTPAQQWSQHGQQITGLAAKCLNVSNTPIPFGGLAVNLATCNGSRAQQWQVVNAPTILKGVGTKCLDIINSNTAPGARLQILECNRGPNSQTFTFTAAGEIRNSVGECLDVMFGDPTRGQVQVYTCNGTPAQRWHRLGRQIVGLNNGAIQQCLSTVTTYQAGARSLESGQDHTPVGLVPCNYTEAQQWFAEDLYQKGPATLLIVAPDAFVPSLTTFVAHKVAIGVSTTLLPMSQVRLNYPASDDALAIKYAIEDHYRNFATQYVLLAGDTSQVPIRYRRILDGGGGTTQSFVFSDLYYANIYNGHQANTGSDLHLGFDNWDSNGNGYYDEQDWSNPVANPDNVDGFPDVAVGRIPAYNASVLQNALAKIIAYENLNPVYGGSGFPPVGRFAWAADACYGGAYNMVMTLNSSFGGAFNEYAEEVSACPGTAAGFVTDDSAWSQFQNAVQNTQFEWLTYIGHGGSDAWGYYSSWNNTQVSRLTNVYKPVALAAACNTAQFANVPARMPLSYNIGIYDPNASTFSSTCIGSDFLFNPNGGTVAYIGENVTMQDTLGTNFAGSLFTQHANGYVRLGDMWRTAQQAYFNQNTPYTGADPFAPPRIYLGVVNLLGDPSMRTP